KELLPRHMHLWTPITDKGGKTNRRTRGTGSAAKTYELEVRECAKINSALSDDIDVSSKQYLNCNKKPKRCFQGKIPGYEGFMLDAATASRLRPDSAEVIVPYLTGRELLSDFKIERWAIDFRDMDMVQASRYQFAFEHYRKYVLPEVQKSFDDTKKNASDMQE